MTRFATWSRPILALALALILPACGAGSGGGPVDANTDAPGPSPSPTPPIVSPSPSPSPAPAPAPAPVPDPVPVPGGAPSTGSGLASPTSLASVTEGVAPLGVVFHAVGATVNGSGERVVQPADGDFASFHYAWDYGDSASGIWPTSHRGRNSDTGYVGAHVYERPGTYTCALTVVDTGGTSRVYAQQIKVTAFSGTTYYVSDAGDDGASGLSESTPWRTVAKVQANLGPNRHFLFRRGGTFDIGATLDIDEPGPSLLGAYGPSTSPRPVLRCGRTGIMLWRDDWRLLDLELRGPSSDALGICLTSAGGLDRLLFLRVALRGFVDALVMSNIEHAPPHDSVVVADCESTGAAVNGFYVGARRLALLGNTVSDPGISHCTRVWQANRSVIGHNVFVRPGGDRHSLKLHGPPTWETTPHTEYVVVSNNRFQGNILTVIVAPQNAISDEPVSHVLIERNRTQSVSTTLADYVVEARDVTIRNNIMDGSLSPRFCGVAVQAGGIVLSPGRIRVENNTMHKGGSGVEAHMAVVESGAFDVRLRNNFGSFPAVPANAKGVVQGTCPGLVMDHNLLTDAPGFTDPGAGDFYPLPSSPALNGGLPSIFVRDDYNVMPRGPAPDLGAYER